MSLLSFPEISVNSGSVTRGNNYKLLNQAFTTTYGIYTEETPRLYMRDPACKRGPASIGTSESDPRPVCGARRLPGARLLTEVLRCMYMYMKWIQDKIQKAALISTLQYNFSNFRAIAVQFWCILLLGYLNRAKKFLGNGRLGGGRPPRPPLNTPLAPERFQKWYGTAQVRIEARSADGGGELGEGVGSPLPIPMQLGGVGKPRPKLNLVHSQKMLASGAILVTNTGE